jgi:hypothetical protein
VQPDSGSFDERVAFRKFRDAFADLLGRHTPISPAEMEAFTTFILQVTYPPNPIARLDSVLTPDEARGRELFHSVNCGIPAACEGQPGCPTLTCESCHRLDPDANPGTAAPGFFGTSGFSSFDFDPQLIKTPHLRNLYQKVGMFGNPPNPGFPNTDNSHQGDQIRGFGFIHDGNVDTLFRFHHGLSFTEEFVGVGNNGIPDGPEGTLQRRQFEAFMLAFPTNLAPIVGQQITLTGPLYAATLPRVTLLRQRADAGECDLVAKTELGGVEVGFVYAGAGAFRRDRRFLPPISEAWLRLLAVSGHPVTYTCTPPGSGRRVGVDRDGDGAWDGDERAAGTDPADPSSTPSP